MLMATFVAIAVVFGGAGFLIGQHFGTRIVVVKPTEDSARKDWPWPANDGQPVPPPVHPRAPDHAPTIELVIGKATEVLAQDHGSSHIAHAPLDPAGQAQE